MCLGTGSMCTAPTTDLARPSSVSTTTCAGPRRWTTCPTGGTRGSSSGKTRTPGINWVCGFCSPPTYVRGRTGGITSTTPLTSWASWGWPSAIPRRGSTGFWDTSATRTEPSGAGGRATSSLSTPAYWRTTTAGCGCIPVFTSPRPPRPPASKS